MSTMQGNPHFPADGNIPADVALAKATLALAFEQRTTTLVALWTAPFDSEGNYDTGSELAGVDYGQMAQEIKGRLGLNGDAS